MSEETTETEAQASAKGGGGIFKFVASLFVALLGVLRLTLLGVWSVIQDIVFMPFGLIRRPSPRGSSSHKRDSLVALTRLKPRSRWVARPMRGLSR